MAPLTEAWNRLIEEYYPACKVCGERIPHSHQSLPNLKKLRRSWWTANSLWGGPFPIVTTKSRRVNALFPSNTPFHERNNAQEEANHRA